MALIIQQIKRSKNIYNPKIEIFHTIMNAIIPIETTINIF